MRILLAISLVAFAALLWASISIAQHIRQTRRKRRHDIAERARLRAEKAVAPAPQPASSMDLTAADQIPAADAGHPAPPPPIPEPALTTQVETIAPPARAKLTYFKWDDDGESTDDFPSEHADSASETTGDPEIPIHAARQANQYSGTSMPAHKDG